MAEDNLTELGEELLCGDSYMGIHLKVRHQGYRVIKVKFQVSYIGMGKHLPRVPASLKLYISIRVLSYSNLFRVPNFVVSCEVKLT